MEVALMFTFYTLPDAERVRAHLIRAGMASDAIEVTVADDEAGGGQGNFLVGDGKRVTGDAYDVNFRQPLERSVVTMMLRCAERDVERMRARLVELGGTDVERRAAPGARAGAVNARLSLR